MKPTRQQIHSACLSYRHDYGILDEVARESLQITAMDWFRAWKRAGVKPEESSGEACECGCRDVVCAECGEARNQTGKEVE